MTVVRWPRIGRLWLLCDLPLLVVAILELVMTLMLVGMRMGRRGLMSI